MANRYLLSCLSSSQRRLGVMNNNNNIVVRTIITSSSTNRANIATKNVLLMVPKSTTTTWMTKNIFFFSSDSSITYSGGQASEGQGGFYGSGGARVLTDDGTTTADDGTTTSKHRIKMIALSQDVELIRSKMIELERLESLLRDNTDEGTTSTKIELKHAIKKLMTSPDVINSLNNLEINGEPCWGLSSEERELIIAAREKVNEC